MDANTGEVDWRAIDRKLLDQLIARHGLPPPAVPVPPEEAARRRRAAMQDRAMAASDPGFIRHIERHERSGDGLMAPIAAPEPGRPIGIDWEAAGLRELGEIRELGPSEELWAAMEHKTPQSFLRDLHRPVQTFGETRLRRQPALNSSDVLARVRAMVGDVMSRRPGEVGAVQLTSALARLGLEELRETLARPWEESRPAEPLPLSTRIPGMSDKIWFGSGGYDPDL